MSLVPLVSGGLDSTLMALLAKEEAVEQWPLFVDYGQKAARKEWETCQEVFKRYGLPSPVRMNFRDFGRNVPSGLTSKSCDLVADVFLPGRNLLLLVAAAAFAAKRHASAVAIGLLDEGQRLFEDQSSSFLSAAESVLRVATASPVRVQAPLIGFSKRDVLRMARERGLSGTYSCHLGRAKPCGLCLSCRERMNAEG